MTREWGKPLGSYCAIDSEFREWDDWCPSIPEKITVRPKKNWKRFRTVLELILLLGVCLFVAHINGLF